MLPWVSSLSWEFKLEKKKITLVNDDVFLSFIVIFLSQQFMELW